MFMPFGLLARKLFAFPIFWLWANCWRLFQKSVMRTK